MKAVFSAAVTTAATIAAAITTAVAVVTTIAVANSKAKETLGFGRGFFFIRLLPAVGTRGLRSRKNFGSATPAAPPQNPFHGFC